MCDLMDLLAEIPDTTITVTQQDCDTLISVPKRGETLLQFTIAYPGMMKHCKITVAMFPNFQSCEFNLSAELEYCMKRHFLRNGPKISVRKMEVSAIEDETLALFSCIKLNQIILMTVIEGFKINMLHL